MEAKPIIKDVGDTKAITITVVNKSRVPIVLTTEAFKLQVNTVATYSGTPDIMEKDGEIIDAANGKVKFPIDAINKIDTYYYKVIMTHTNAEIETIGKNLYKVV